MLNHICEQQEGRRRYEKPASLSIYLNALRCEFYRALLFGVAPQRCPLSLGRGNSSFVSFDDAKLQQNFDMTKKKCALGANLEIF